MTDQRFDNLNDTELATMAAMHNMEAHRDLPRPVLLALCEGDEVELPQRTLNKKRLAIMQYINDNWSQVNYQISCPAQSQHPYACFGCTDCQTSQCVLDNSWKFLEE